MLRATLKGLLARKLRLALTAFAVVLGVSFVSGTYIYTDTVQRAFTELFGGIYEGVDLQVRAEAGYEAPAGGSSIERDRVPGSMLEEVRAVEGVDAAAGTIGGYAQVVAPDGEPVQPQGPPTLGFGWGGEPELSPLELRDGRPPQRPDEVMIDAATAAAHGFGVGDEVTVLLLESRPREFRISGIAGFGEEDSLGGSTLVVFEQQTAQRVLGGNGSYDSIEIGIADDADRAEVQERVAAALPDGYEVVSGTTVADESSAAVAERLGFLNTALLVFAGVALFVGAFIIYNTFAIVVAQRARELALMRAIGATRQQVAASVLAESLLVGVAASVLGAGAGVLVAMALRGVLEAFGVGLPQTSLVLEQRTLLVALALGVGITVVAALYPAVRASRVSPLAAMRGESSRSRSRPWAQLTGALLMVAGLGLLAVGLTGGGLRLVGGGAGALLVGAALLSPALVAPVAAVVGAPVARLSGFVGALAQRNSTRNPARTASTAAALMIGLALMGFTAIFASSLRASIDEMLDRTFQAELVVQSTGFEYGAGFSPQVARDLRDRDEIDIVSPVRWGEFRIDGRESLLVGVDLRTYGRVVDLGFEEGGFHDREGSPIYVQRSEADRHGYELGDTVEAEFARTGRQELRIAGIYEHNNLFGGSYIVPGDSYRTHYQNRLLYSVLTTSADDVPPDQARAAVEEVIEGHANLQLQDQAAFREQQEELINRLLGLIFALLALSVLIALLGIVNTLALSVFERTREIGLLRAVGMTQRQTRSMVRGEAVIVALLGAVLGLALGVLFGWAVVQALHDEGVTAFSVPVPALAGFLVVSAVAGAVAAILPARRAARMDVLRAIASD